MWYFDFHYYKEIYLVNIKHRRKIEKVYVPALQVLLEQLKINHQIIIIVTK